MTEKITVKPTTAPTSNPASESAHLTFTHKPWKTDDVKSPPRPTGNRQKPE